jgi:hypothetical protein
MEVLKTLNVTFTCEEFSRLEHAKEIKGGKNWHDFIMSLAEMKEA